MSVAMRCKRKSKYGDLDILTLADNVFSLRSPRNRIIVCGRHVALRLDTDDLERHRAGLLVQDAFTNETGVPYLSPAVQPEPLHYLRIAGAEPLIVFPRPPCGPRQHVWELVCTCRCCLKFMHRVHDGLRTIRRNVVATSPYHDPSAARGETR
jgi:hypothetical protein